MFDLFKSQQSCETELIFKHQKIEAREPEVLSYTAGKIDNWDLNWGSLAPEPVFLVVQHYYILSCLCTNELFNFFWSLKGFVAQKTVKENPLDNLFTGLLFHVCIYAFI